MPKLVEHDPAAAKRIETAIRAILGGTVKDAELKRREERGTLKLNFSTVSAEANVARHLIDHEDCIYPEQYKLIVASMAVRGVSVPLKEQLDGVRRNLAERDAQLARCQTYNLHILTRLHQLDLEVARLNELIETMDAGAGGETELIGTGRVLGLPPPQRPPRKGGATPRRR